jgi:predicted nucleotide-binding protein
MAKLAGIRKTLTAALAEQQHLSRPGMLRRSFAPDVVGYHFKHAEKLVDQLRVLLPALYGDFQPISTEPDQDLSQKEGQPRNLWYGRDQVERLTRDIDQVLEIRANSELSQPVTGSASNALRRVFISHGRSNDWREVQIYIEKDVRLATLELAQEPNAGQTIIEKLEKNASSCDSAVIVMTGDDINAEGEVRARENVMHEIGFFQARYGRARVCFLHEESVTIPTNLSGVVYVPFPKGSVSASFGVLIRELGAMYRN